MIKQFEFGFGCASLSSLNSRKKSLEILSIAYDNDITHYDVARLYGMGSTENILGEFAKNKRDKISIATKFGLNPPSIGKSNAKLISIVKGVVNKMPGLKRRITDKVHSNLRTDFSVKNANASLERSLKELGTHYIDYFLMHEALKDDIINDELIIFLKKKKDEGKILEFGIASQLDKIGNNCSYFDESFIVFQFEDDLFNGKIKLRNSDDKLLITHSVLKSLNVLENKLDRCSKIELDSYSNALNLDLKETGILPSLLLYISSKVNASEITLFSSTNCNHINNNIQNINRFKAINLNWQLCYEIMNKLIYE